MRIRDVGLDEIVDGARFHYSHGLLVPWRWRAIRATYRLALTVVRRLAV
jgi:hypothetical protein